MLGKSWVMLLPYSFCVGARLLSFFPSMIHVRFCEISLSEVSHIDFVVRLLAELRPIIKYEVGASPSVAGHYFLIRWELEETPPNVQPRIFNRDVWVLKREELEKLKDDIVTVLGK